MIAKHPEDTGAGSKEAFHFSTSFDISLLSMSKHIASISPLLVDRSFMSNVVLGEIQGRITHEEGIKYLDFLAESGYLDKAHVIYVDKHDPKAGRSDSKDDWDFLGYEEQKEKYEKYFSYLKEKYGWEPVRFTNQMIDTSSQMFDKTVLDMIMNRSKTQLKGLLGKFLSKEFIDTIL
jgi:hypothetical protein